jgi:uncharacterized membrane-anchored protein YhcB (DUF1043 family)
MWQKLTIALASFILGLILGAVRERLLNESKNK